MGAQQNYVTSIDREKKDIICGFLKQGLYFPTVLLKGS